MIALIVVNNEKFAREIYNYFLEIVQNAYDLTNDFGQVATVAINGGQNAGLLAIEMISLFDESIKKNLKEFRENLHTQVRTKNSKLSTIGPDNYLQNK